MSLKRVISKPVSALLARYRTPPSSTLITEVRSARSLQLLTGRFHFEVPMERTLWSGSFVYGPHHPWVRALQHGREELDDYYRRFRPGTVAERYLLEADAHGLERSPLDRNPWLRKGQVDTAHFVAYNNWELRKYFGPTDPVKVDEEWQRLVSVRSSIRSDGYRPQAHGHIQGFFLLDGDEERFFVTAGQHRAAVLAAEGWTTLPVSFQATYPRTVSVADARHFPGVVAGDYAPEAAEMVFRQHFVLDGSQQYRSYAGGGPVASGSSFARAAST